MDRAAQQIQRTHRARLLRMPGVGWMSGDTWNPLALRVLERALEQPDLEEIVLCGHSTCLAAADVTALPLKRPLSLSQRVLQTVAWNKAAQQRTVRHFQSLRELPQVKERLEHGSIRLHCLYYLHEYDSFLLYDQMAAEFVSVEKF